MSFQPRYVNIEGAASIEGGTAVVLDVLRAYTTAAWAFALGAERVVLSDDLNEALLLKSRLPGALALKDSEPVPGFELSNSPVELQHHDLHGKTIVQKTTAGTVGAVAAKRAEHLYCASFLNAEATAEAIYESGAQQATFVVTGEGGAADEDQSCAEYIAALVQAMQGRHPEMNTGVSEAVAPIGVDPAPYLQRVAASNAARIMAQRVADGTPGVHIDDVTAAMEVNRFDFVMVAREEHLEGSGAILVLRAYNRSND